MERVAVTSSQMASVGYNAASQVLEIQFKNTRGDGSVYQYTDVPPKIYDGFMQSESKGKYFGAHIKGKFAYSKVS